ncbi:MAG: hypothetical protein H7308_07035 [Chthonomonadaceae bacterium]|nr:hypothetical protein [Chthonomonadaceae bacterium]
MEITKYTIWAELHRRVVNEEPLDAAEQVLYRAGCDEIEAESMHNEDISRMTELRKRIAESDAESERLRNRRMELDAKILRLEAMLEARTRQTLGIGAS